MNRRKEIIDELISIAPNLPDFKARNAMSVPDGYFEKMTSRVMEKMEQDNHFVKEISEIEPDLPDFKTQSEMSVPEGYFDQMTAQVLQKMQKVESIEESPKQARVFRIQRFYKIAAAAAIMAVMIAGWFLIRPTGSSTEAFAEITSDEAYEYVIDHLDEFATALNESTNLESVELEIDYFNEIPAEDAKEMIEEILETIDLGDLNQIM